MVKKAFPHSLHSTLRGAAFLPSCLRARTSSTQSSEQYFLQPCRVLGSLYLGNTVEQLPHLSSCHCKPVSFSRWQSLNSRPLCLARLFSAFFLQLSLQKRFGFAGLLLASKIALQCSQVFTVFMQLLQFTRQGGGVQYHNGDQEICEVYLEWYICTTPRGSTYT